MPGAVKAGAKRSGKRNKWGDPRGETVYAGFPESLDSGVPRSGIETSSEGRARGEGWIGRARSSRRNSAGLLLMRMPHGESFRARGDRSRGFHGAVLLDFANQS